MKTVTDVCIKTVSIIQYLELVKTVRLWSCSSIPLTGTTEQELPYSIGVNLQAAITWQLSGAPHSCSGNCIRIWNRWMPAPSHPLPPFSQSTGPGERGIVKRGDAEQSPEALCPLLSLVNPLMNSICKDKPPIETQEPNLWGP